MPGCSGLGPLTHKAGRDGARALIDYARVKPEVNVLGMDFVVVEHGSDVFQSRRRIGCRQSPVPGPLLDLVIRSLQPPTRCWSGHS